MLNPFYLKLQKNEVQGIRQKPKALMQTIKAREKLAGNQVTENKEQEKKTVKLKQKALTQAKDIL